MNAVLFLLGQIKTKISSEIRLEDNCFGATSLYSYKYPQISITDDSFFLLTQMKQLEKNK